jgi:hypothetical protein
VKRIGAAVLTVAVLAAVLLAATGCTRVRLQDSPNTSATTTNESIALSGATALEAKFSQGVGDLKVRAASSATDAVGAVFTYAPASWKPEVVSSVEGTSARLTITQPNHSDVTLFSNMKNEWTVTMPRGVVTDLTLDLGVGHSDVDLRGVDLAGLNMDTGVGDTTVDLSGPRTSDLSASIDSGVGTLTVRLPKNVGVRVTGHDDGVGTFKADGFISQGSDFVNEAYSGTGPKIEIDLNRGVGDVTLVLVD